MKSIMFVLALTVTSVGCHETSSGIKGDRPDAEAAPIKAGETAVFSLPETGRPAAYHEIELRSGNDLIVQATAYGVAIQTHLFDPEGNVVRPDEIRGEYSTSKTRWDINSNGTYKIYTNAYFNVLPEGASDIELFATCIGDGCPAALECPAKADFDECFASASDYLGESDACYEGSHEAKRDCLEVTMENVSEGGLDSYLYPCHEGAVPTCGDNNDGQYYEWVYDAVHDACRSYAFSR